MTRRNAVVLGVVMLSVVLSLSGGGHSAARTAVQSGQSWAQGVCPPVSNTTKWMIVYGTVLIDGGNAPIGTVVEARSPRGDTVGCFEVTAAGHYGAMYVFGEDGSDPPLPGMRVGETVAFHVNGVLAMATPPLVWQDNDWSSHPVDLSAGSGPTCYTLTRTHTGSGADPVASPANSDACPAGQYVEGEVIGLTASPATGWHVGSWTGTDNDASTATANQVTMPASNRTVTVNYVEDAPATATPQCRAWVYLPIVWRGYTVPAAWFERPDIRWRLLR